MSVSSQLLGYIQEAWPGVAGDAEEQQRKLDLCVLIAEQNDRILAALPVEDQWPPVCKEMFGWPSSKARMITYQSRLVHFAASMKEFEFCIPDWLGKFERLLQQLYWEKVYLRINTVYLGSHEFSWKPKQQWLDAFHKGWISPIQEWDFTTTLEDINSLRRWNH